ncbi:hypothetical protein [Ktedonospora formicarum]|nr:hypothetical protein [Ktedonospora formicarum]
MKPYHSIFREEAIEEYIQKRERDILPRFLSPSLILLLYVLLCLLLITGFLISYREIPIFAAGSGIILPGESANVFKDNTAVIMVFLPAQYAAQIRVDAYAQLEVMPTGQQFTGTIKHIEAGSIGLDEARKRYRLNDRAAQSIAQSSVAATILPAAVHPAHLSAGDPVSAQVQIGSQRLLSLFSGR